MLMIMEYFELGCLKDLLRNSKPTADGVLELLPGAKCFNAGKPFMRSAEMARMGCDVAAGMHYLSGKGVIHRDLAARS